MHSNVYNTISQYFHHNGQIKIDFLAKHLTILNIRGQSGGGERETRIFLIPDNYLTIR